MKLSVARSELQRGLVRVQAIVEKRGTMPILANVLLEASKDGKTGALQLTATDLEVGVRGSHTAKVEKPGSLTVSAKKLFEIVRELPDEPVHLEATANSYLELQCARSRFTLAGTAPDEYPNLPGATPKSLVPFQAAVLSSMIERTLYATSADETRYNLNGVYFEILEDGEKVRLVATDGHRLAYVDRSLGTQLTGIKGGVIVPRKGLQELKRLVDEEDADEVELGFEGNSALARKGGVTLVMRLIEGEFPNYRQVLPKELTKRLVVPSDLLSQALRRTVLLSSERSRAVKLELGEGRLRISSSSPDVGEASEELDVDYRGDDLQIGFNGRYLLDCLAAFGAKEVEVGLGDDLSPACVRPTDDPDSLAVVMPMRI